MQSCKDILVLNDTLYYLTFRSIAFYSTDEGKNWIRKTPLTDDIRQTQIIEDQDTLFSTGSYSINFSSDGGESWGMYNESLYSGYSKNYRLYKEDSIIIVVSDGETSVRISADHGSTWQFSNLGFFEFQPWIDDILIIENRIILFSRTKGTHITEDFGITWEKYENEVFKSDNRIYKYARINNSDIILYGKGVLYKTFDNGLTWEIEETENEEVRANRFSYREGNNIYSMDLGTFKIYKSTDLGRTWNELQVNMEPDLDWFHIIPYHGSLVLLTTTDVFVSDDDGKNWRKYEVDLLASDGNYLYFRNGMVYGDYIVLTSNYGIWIAKLSDLGIDVKTSVESEIESNYLYTFPPYPLPAKNEVKVLFYWDINLPMAV